MAVGYNPHFSYPKAIAGINAIFVLFVDIIQS